MFSINAEKITGDRPSLVNIRDGQEGEPVNMLGFKKILIIMFRKCRKVIAAALVLFIAGTAIAQDAVNDVKVKPDGNKATEAAPNVKKQPVMESKDDKGRDALVNALKKDKDRKVRRSAAKSLASMKSKDQLVIKTFIRHLNDADPAVRKEAADGLKKIGTLAVQPLTVALKKHKNPIVRRQAATLIGEISRVNRHVKGIRKKA